MNTPLKYSFSLVNGISGALRDELVGMFFVESFSSDKNELFINLSNDKSEFGIRLVWTANNCLLLFRDKMFVAPVPHYKWFSNLNGLSVQQVVQHPNNRSFQISFSNNFSLVFKLYNHLSNVLCFKNKEVESHFRVNIINDSSLALSAFEAENKHDSSVDVENFPKNKELLRWLTEYNQEIISNHTFNDQKNELIDTIHSSIKKLEKKLGQTELALKKMPSAESYIQLGDIIMSNLDKLKSSENDAHLFDFYHDKNINIKLKKDLSPLQNAEHYYRKSKSVKPEIERLEAELSKTREVLSIHYFQLEKLNMAQNGSELKPFNRKKKGKTVDVQLFRRFEFEGYIILVGKNAANNDLLTLKYASKDDMWLHAQGTGGSHVVLKKKPGKEISTQAIAYAASIAAFYSSLKGSSLVPVIYTSKKFVRKPKGSNPGEVAVQNEHIILVPPYSSK